MNTNLLKSALCLCAVIAAGAPAGAGPLQRADVPAEPVWVLHADCDSLRSSATGKFVLQELEQPEVKAKLAAFQTIFDFDPRKQLHGLTLYSTGKAPEDAVLLVYADFDADRLLTMARAAKDYQCLTNKQHLIHTWIDEKKKARHGARPRVYAAIHGANVVVFAQQETRVAEALDVLDRAAPNLAASGLFPAMGASASGAFVEAAARKMELPASDPNAALFRLSKEAYLQVGEAQGQLKATLKLDANDEDTARQMASVGQGLLALMKLQKDDPGSVQLAEALSLKQDGVSVTATLAVPIDQAIALVKAGAARKAEKKAEKE